MTMQQFIAILLVNDAMIVVTESGRDGINRVMMIMILSLYLFYQLQVSLLFIFIYIFYFDWYCHEEILLRRIWRHHLAGERTIFIIIALHADFTLLSTFCLGHAAYAYQESKIIIPCHCCCFWKWVSRLRFSTPLYHITALMIDYIKIVLSLLIHTRLPCFILISRCYMLT